MRVTALVLLLQAGLAAGCWQSCLTYFLNEESRLRCLACARENVDIGRLPAGYAIDLNRFVTTDQDYTSGFCGTREGHPSEGVDLEQHPTGWRPVTNEAGEVTGYTGCETATNFPGPNVVSIQSHEIITRMIKTAPRRMANGEVWRGNELGLLVLNNELWPNVSPKSIGLGSTPQQHKLIRPYLDRLLGSCDQACRNELDASAKAFLQDRQTVDTSVDMGVWVHEYLFNRMFPGEALPITAAEFVDMQGSFITLSSLTQLLPGWVNALLLNDVMERMQAYFEKVRVVVATHYPEVQDMDCSPTRSCVDQFASGFIDALIAAGGLSVPSGIRTGLWVLYGNTAPYGDTFPQGFQLDKAQADLFFYESLRFFPPVVGFPWWETRPTKPEEDQFAGGERVILNLALAQRDPNVWGADAAKFRVRSKAEYANNFIGFAEGAQDATVANGAQDRVCPAKLLAVQMGKAWFANWDQDAWVLDGVDETEFKLVTPFVDDMVLRRK